jgi:hypothetical protein
MPNVLLIAGTSLPAKINLVRQFFECRVLLQRPRLLYSESELARAFDECAGMDLKRLGAGCPCCFDFDAMCEVVSGGKDFSYIVEIPPIANFSRTIDCFEQDGVLAAGDHLLAYFAMDEDFILRGETFVQYFLQRYTDERIRFSVSCHERKRETFLAWMSGSGIKESAIFFGEEGFQYEYASVSRSSDQRNAI